MTHSAGQIQRRFTRSALAGALAAAIAASLVACESPVRSNFAQGPGSNYTDSLITRAILDANYGKPITEPLTVAGPVRELVRVDQPGPAIAAASPTNVPGLQEVSPATMPASSYPAATTPSEEGRLASSLNMAEPVFNLTLQSAIARTMKHSLAVKVEAYNPAIRESQVIEAESIFDPVAFGTSTWQANDDPSLSGGVNPSNGQNWYHQLGIRKLLPTGGTLQVSASMTYRRVPEGSPLAPGLTNSNYQAGLNLLVSQPLLRGFGADVTEATIFLAQRDQRISQETFRRQVITTVANVEEAYQNLVLARTEVEILDRLVRASEQTNKLVQDRKDLDATKASLSQAASALLTRRVGLLQAQRNYREASDRLKNLINDPEIGVRENTLINPVDRPMAEPVMYSTADCIETALRQRTEMQEARLQIERADIIVKVSKNDLLPKLDLIVGLQSNGLQNDFDQAFGGSFSSFNSMDFNAGVKLEFPLGNRLAEAALVRRQNERRQAITQFRQVAETVVTDVKMQLRQMLTLYPEIQLSNEARIQAGNAFEGIVEIEDIRAKTPEFLQLKLDTQGRLAEAEQTLARATVNYNLAIMRLEQAKGTLLEFNRISLNRPPQPSSEDDFGKSWFMGRNIWAK